MLKFRIVRMEEMVGKLADQSRKKYLRSYYRAIITSDGTEQFYVLILTGQMLT